MSEQLTGRTRLRPRKLLWLWTQIVLQVEVRVEDGCMTEYYKWRDASPEDFDVSLELRAGKAINDLKPIADAPRDGSTVLLFWLDDDSDIRMVRAATWKEVPSNDGPSGSHWLSIENGRIYQEPSHFIPLPTVRGE